MSAFSIHPPVHLTEGRPVASSAEAAAVVRRHAIAHCSLAASVLFRRLERIDSPDEAQRVALDFRAWAAREGLLLTHPKAGPQ